MSAEDFAANLLSIKIPSTILPTDISNISHRNVLGPLGRWNCSHHGMLGGRVAMQVHDQGSRLECPKFDLQELLCGLCGFGPPEIGQ